MTCNCGKCQGRGPEEESSRIHPSRLEECPLCGEEKMKGGMCSHCYGKGVTICKYCQEEYSVIEGDCPTCFGTGEVFGETEQLKSRSVQRREALQKGEPMPEFDKPEMPSESYYKVIEGSFTPLKMFIWQSGLDGDVPLYSCSELAHGVKGRWYIPEIYVERNYLPADKVRELVQAYSAILHYPRSSSEWQQACDTVSGLIHDLFPEGLGGEE